MPFDIQCTRQDVMKVLEACAAVASKKSTMPITESLRLEARGATLRVDATDLTLSMTGEAPCAIAGEGALCLKAHDMVEWIKLLPVDKFQIRERVKENASSDVQIKAIGAKRQYTMPLLPADSFPSVRQVPEDATVMTLASCSLDSLIGGVKGAAEQEGKKTNIHAVCLEWEANQVKAIATTGSSILAVCRTVEKEKHSASALVPLKSALALQSLCKAAPQVAMVVTDQALFASCGTLKLSLLLCPEPFMPYKQLLDSVRPECCVPMTVMNSKMAEALRGVAIASKPNVVLTLRTGALGLSVADTDAEGSDELDVTYAGGDLKCCFDGKLLREAVESAGANELTLLFGTQWSHFLIVQSAPTEEASDYVAVMSPIRM